ncbi:prokaryotic phospholipase A2-domain-containing protein [Aspergillus leporis]|uniref:Prokaryotic phospholipase A2-domain-containing protein n=1 Tax=Aspergillus leporis TaxID=41062 RepID=A0A5N5XAU3_9EURO|nr:prokaryotic phospholipase A2-domain-containing protein [Aspergillus leporis]
MKALNAKFSILAVRRTIGSFGMRFSIWTVLMLFTNTNALLASSNPKRQNECTAATTDELIFKTNIEAFSAAREAREPPCFDWSSDDCTMAPDMPVGFNFEPSCRRHDFGYRNVGAQERLTEALRKRIDDVFKRDLYNECGRQSGFSQVWRRIMCLTVAEVYYRAVVLCGDGDCFD